MTPLATFATIIAVNACVVLFIILCWCDELSKRAKLAREERDAYREENKRLRRIVDGHVDWLVTNLMDSTLDKAFDHIFDLCEENGFPGAKMAEKTDQERR